MLGIFVNFGSLLVALRTLKNTFPTCVSLMIMKSYLLMERVFIVTMISNKLKILLLLRVLMKLLLWLKSMIVLSTNQFFLTYLNIGKKTMLIMSMSKNLLREWLLLWKKIMIWWIYRWWWFRWFDWNSPWWTWCLLFLWPWSQYLWKWICYSSLC